MSDLCVLIPAKNEELVIAKTLNSILAAHVAPQDIYVIDDGSDDRTGDIARGLGVNVMRNDVNLGKARSVNKITLQFKLTERYKYIAMMDADTEVTSNYYDAIQAAFRADASNEVALVCGRPRNMVCNWVTAYRCMSYFLTHFVYRGGQSNMGVINVAPGCASTYRSDVFAQLDWNKDTLVEDMDVTIQTHRMKLGKIIYVPEAVVFTQDPKTLRDYIKQIIRWQTGTWQVGKKHSMFFGAKKIDWEYKLLMGEGMIFSTMLLLSPILLPWWPRMAYAVGFDTAIVMAVSMLCAIVDRRWDVLLWSPLYPVFRLADCSVLVYTFITTVVLGKKVDHWFSVKRY